MSVAQFTVLNHFVRLGLETSSPSRLASAFQVTKGAITNSLHRLVALGFATSEPDPADARGKIVRITAAGRAARETAIQALAPRMQALAAQIDIAELEAILPTLERFRRVLDAARNG
jgi:DNA-binding MarR family transcriptional regulator